MAIITILKPGIILDYPGGSQIPSQMSIKEAGRGKLHTHRREGYVKTEQR